ncbi:MAG: hypothetical protein ACI4VF_08350 [Lachnospirales bacterium]
MANFLDTSLPFLSAVENGKKNVPKSWINKIVEHYNLDESEKAELEQSIEDSRTQMKISLANVSTPKRGMALQFARSFENMDDETAKKIIEILENGGK